MSARIEIRATGTYGNPSYSAVLFDDQGTRIADLGVSMEWRDVGEPEKRQVCTIDLGERPLLWPVK